MSAEALAKVDITYTLLDAVLITIKFCVYCQVFLISTGESASTSGQTLIF